jgi:archaellum component FlaC
MIYREAAVNFVIAELPELNHLLESIPYDGEEHDATRILISICSNAFEFNVQADAVRKFYEIWWIDRVDNFEEILLLCSKKNEGREQAKLINQITERLTKLEDTLKLLSAKLDEQSESTATATENVEQDRSRIAKIESSVQNATAQIIENTATVSKTNAQIETLNDKVQALSESVETITQQVTKQAEIAGLQRQIDKLTAESGTILDIANEAATELVGSLAIELQGKIAEQSQNLAALSEQVAAGTLNKPTTATPTVIISGKAPYQSPLSETIRSAPPAYKITTELEFLSVWQTMLSQQYDVQVPSELLAAYHSVFLANRTIVSDFKLASTWISCLGWSSFTKHLVASPLWSTEEDWHDGVAHLLAEPSSSAREPRHLMIHNYNVAVVDCYLVPTLLLWALRGQKRNVYQKLFLIPSEDKSAVLPSVIEHAGLINRYDSEKPTKLHFLDSIKIPTIARKDTANGVDPHIASKWAEAWSQTSFDIGPIEKTFKLKTSDWLISRFRDTVSTAGRFFQESSAAGVGIYHHILPWVASKLEETEYNAVRKYCSDLPNVEYQ